jgi:hypothetical protein
MAAVVPNPKTTRGFRSAESPYEGVQGKIGSPRIGQLSLVKVMGLICSLDAPLSWPS